MNASSKTNYVVAVFTPAEAETMVLQLKRRLGDMLSRTADLACYPVETWSLDERQEYRFLGGEICRVQRSVEELEVKAKGVTYGL